MHTFTIITTIISVIFLVFLIRAVTKVVRSNRFQKEFLEQERKLRAHRKALKRNGYKEFFIGGKSVFAKNYKEAQAIYQANLKKGAYNPN